MGVSVAKVAKAFWKERSANWKPRTERDYKICHDHLLEFLKEDTDIKTITYDHGRDYKDFATQAKGSIREASQSVSY